VGLAVWLVLRGNKGSPVGASQRLAARHAAQAGAVENSTLHRDHFSRIHGLAALFALVGRTSTPARLGLAGIIVTARAGFLWCPLSDRGDSSLAAGNDDAIKVNFAVGMVLRRNEASPVAASELLLAFVALDAAKMEDVAVQNVFLCRIDGLFTDLALVGGTSAPFAGGLVVGILLGLPLRRTSQRGRATSSSDDLFQMSRAVDFILICEPSKVGSAQLLVALLAAQAAVVENAALHLELLGGVYGLIALFAFVGGTSAKLGRGAATAARFLGSPFSRGRCATLATRNNDAIEMDLAVGLVLRGHKASPVGASKLLVAVGLSATETLDVPNLSLHGVLLGRIYGFPA